MFIKTHIFRHIMQYVHIDPHVDLFEEEAACVWGGVDIL